MIQYSIIIPHYNSLDVLPRAIESVPDRDDIEILVIDNSPTPINSNLFSNRKNVHVYYSERTKGAGHARNVGIKNANGKWLFFLDADDFFTENAFVYIDKYNNTEVDIIYFKTTSCYSDTRKPAHRAESTNQIIESYLQTGDESSLRFGWGAPWAKMIRHSLVTRQNIVFDEVKASNDIMFSLQVGYYAKNIFVSTDLIYCITLRNGSLTQTPSLENLTARIDVVCRYNTFIKKHKIPYQQLSLMHFLFLIYSQYGIGPTLRLFFYSIKKGNNPFNGASRWYNTYKSLRKSSTIK